MYQGKFDKKIKQAAEPAPVKKSSSAPVKRSRGPRLSGVIFYAVFFLCIFLFYVATYFGLLGLRNWLTRYEMAQPATKSEEVFEKLFIDPDWGALYEIAGVQDTAFENKDAFASYMENTVGDSKLTYMETSTGLSEDKKYIVRLGKEKIAAFTLVDHNHSDSKTEIPDWQLGTIELYFAREESYRIQKLGGHTVYVNNVPLDDSSTIAMNLAFACSLRMGEILGLTWKNVHIEDSDIASDNAYIYIEQELTRASKQAIEMLGKKEIYYVFQPLMPNTSTRLVLKKPKTDSSIRKIWLPKTVAYILRDWRKSQLELKGFLGDEYQDFDLVVAQANGRPCEERILEKEFNNLKKNAGLPNVVFHSLRHSSTTYKLKLNHGDLKATQGDTGHAEIDMITKVYAHILDEDRKINAQKFECAFYANPDLRNSRPPQPEPQVANLDLAALVEQLQRSPELASTLASLLASQNPR